MPASQSHGLSMKGCRSTVPDTQAADDDVDVDVPCTVVTVRVGADDGGMTGEIFLAELQAKGLRPLHGQVVLYRVLRVEADDILRMASGASLRTNILASALADVAIMVGLHVLPPAVLAVLAIGDQAGHSELRIRRTQGCRADTNPELGSALLVQNGQTGVLVVLKGEIAFGGGMKSEFFELMLIATAGACIRKNRGSDFLQPIGATGLLLDGCHTVHQPFLRLSAESS